MITFNNKLICHGPAKGLRSLSQEEIRSLPMLYRADVAFALQKAPFLWDFIKNLPVNPYDFKYQSLDVKVTMLKKGWYPCIPGWHCDDFYRPSGEQPDVFRLCYNNSRHFMALYGDCSLTEFLTRPMELPNPPRTGTVYGYYNKLINERQLDDDGLVIARTQPEALYEFDSLSFHRGMPAIKDGWRAFVRLTLGDVRPPKNEIRTQVNVYVPHNELEAGW